MTMNHVAVYKSSSIERVDAFYSGDPGAALAYASELLSEAQVLQAAETFADDGQIEADDVGRFANGWLSGTGPLAGKDVDRVIRLGYIEAIRTASDYEPPVPIETFWVTGAGDDFEMHICAGAERVTVFMLIPVRRKYGSSTAASRSWVVRVGDHDDVDGSAPREQLDDGPVPVFKIQMSGGETAS
jgi:hypothetical protein